MSRYLATAIERFGDPLPSWVSIYGVDAATAASARTLDLSPYMKPLAQLQQQLERSLQKASLGTVKLDLKDDDGSLAAALGPGTTSLGTTSRYFGPWVKIQEASGAGLVDVFLGYIDEATVEWNQDRRTTQCTIYHASQILKGRILSDYSQFLRPKPSTAASADSTFTATTADDAIQTVYAAYSPSAIKVQTEQALWAMGKMTWKAQLSFNYSVIDISLPGAVPRNLPIKTSYPVPPTPGGRILIGTSVYIVTSVDYGLSASATVNTPTGDGETIKTQTFSSITLTLTPVSGAPQNLIAAGLAVGATVTWYQTEAERSHYLLRTAITAPGAGTDGQRYMDIDTVDQLTAGDILTVIYPDASNNGRRTTLTLTVIDIDGELARVFTKEPINQAIPTANVKIRRNGTDPVFVDAIPFARQVVAPFALDTSQYIPAQTDLPVVQWLSLDAIGAAQPKLYGVNDVQVLTPTRIRYSRRGQLDSGGNSPNYGVWEGNPSTGWNWMGLTPTGFSTADPKVPLYEWIGDNVFPGVTLPDYAFLGGFTALTQPQFCYIQGDLSGGATVPPNGWRNRWRSLVDFTKQRQTINTRWDGTAVQWSSLAPTPTDDKPQHLNWFYTQSYPGTFDYLSPTFIFYNIPAGATTPTILGTLPTGGQWLAFGVGVYTGPTAGFNAVEGFLGIYTTGTQAPWTTVKAVLFSPTSAGNSAHGDSTIRQTIDFSTVVGAGTTGTWWLGGGLVVRVTTATIGTVAYPTSQLFFVDGVASPPRFVTLEGCEVLPGTICMRTPFFDSASGNWNAGGWHLVVLQTYTDSNFAVNRRARFIRLDQNMKVLNGDPYPSLTFPDDPSTWAKLGDIMADPIPDGIVSARMVRTGTRDQMIGFMGGRPFMVDNFIPLILERIQLAQYDALSFLEDLGAATLATAIPTPAGGINLVSRQAGVLHSRPTGGGTKRTVLADERINPSRRASWAFASEVQVQYTDLLLGQSTVTATCSFQGGKPMSLDLSKILSGPTSALAVAYANAQFFGQPGVLWTETWRDNTTGSLDMSLAPPFWSTWLVGDRYHDEGASAALVNQYKITKINWDPEQRQAQAEITQIPGTVAVP